MSPTKPVIGITCHLALQPAPSGNIQRFHRLSAQYTMAILAAGGLPMLLGTGKDYVPPPMDAISAVDGWLLSGGATICQRKLQRQPKATSARDGSGPL